MTLQPRTAAAVCIALAAAALFPTLWNGFTTWDDPLYVLENPLVRGLSPGSVLTIFTTPQYAGNYHPVTLLAVAAQYALFGAEPFGYHLVSLLLHLIVTFLVFRLSLALTKETLVAAGAALLLGLHPIHVEPVAWIADQKDLLYSGFFLGATLAYVRFRDTGDARTLYRTALPLFLLSLLSKGVAVTLPAALLCIDWHRDGRLRPGAVKEKLPFFALSLLFGVAAFAAQSSAGAISPNDIDGPVGRLLIASRGYVLYIAKLFVPFGLSPFYPYPREIPAHYWAFPVIAAAILFGALRERKQYPLLFTGVAWYTVTVAPVLQLLQVGNASMADRYAYLPSVGILLIAASAFAAAVGRPAASPSRRKLLAATGAVYVLALAGLSATTSAVWRDGATLWSRVVEQFPDSPKGWFNRGYARHTLGEYRAAIADYDRAIALNPDHPKLWSNRGFTRFALGDRAGALADFSRELEARPDDTDSRYWRGNVLASLGRHAEAEADFSVVIDGNPADFEARVRRGLVRTSSGDFPGAEADFSAAISLRPSVADTYFNRANVRAAMKRWDDAIADYSTVLRLSANDRDALYARGIASHLKGDADAACADLRRASSLGAARADSAIVRICAH